MNCPSGGPDVRGTVAGLHRKGEVHGPAATRERGLAKPAVDAIDVSVAGVAGDHNHYRTTKLAGDPDSAVLLLPVEVLEALRAEGWDVGPGDLGENVATRGVPYEAMAPGARVELGEVCLVIARACQPCTQLYHLPGVGAKRGPAFLRAMVGRRGWYARVERGGRVRVGDAVRVGP